MIWPRRASIRILRAAVRTGGVFHLRPLRCRSRAIREPFRVVFPRLPRVPLSSALWQECRRPTSRAACARGLPSLGFLDVEIDGDQIPVSIIFQYIFGVDLPSAVVLFPLLPPRQAPLKFLELHRLGLRVVLAALPAAAARNTRFPSSARSGRRRADSSGCLCKARRRRSAGGRSCAG